MKLILALFIPLFLLIVLSMPLAAASPGEVTGQVVYVIDGDTFDLEVKSHDGRIDDEVIRVRLADLDSPEMYGKRACEAGEIAADYTGSWLLYNFVSLDIDDYTGQDDYGRWIAVCYLEDGRNFNKMLIDSGNAEKKDFKNNEFDPESWWTGDEAISSEDDRTSQWWQFWR